MISGLYKWLVLAAVVFWLPQPVFAITLILKNSDQPVRGFLIKEDARQFEIRVRQSDGSFVERPVLKSDVELVHRPVSTERLAALDPDRPKEYRDYAEELAEKRIDPEAREMSLRLYAIAAHLDPANLGRGALLGMTALAETVEEERRYRALAFILDPDHDRGVLKDMAGGAKESSAKGSEKLTAVGAVRGLEMLRKGRTQEAGQQLRKPGIAEALQPHADIITFDELLDACRSRVRRGPAPPFELSARIVQLELRLLGEDLTEESASAPAASWSHVSATAVRRPTRPLTLESITPFDPRQCVYRDGDWTTP